MRAAVVAVVVASACRTPPAPPTTALQPVAVAPEPDAGPTPPGVVIDHEPASSGEYIGSPSIAVLGDGTYLAAHDYFGPSTTRDRSVVFASTDRGKTWSKRADVVGQWWSTLFVQAGQLYFMGTDRQFGHVVIRRSSDGGATWTSPTTSESGLLSHEVDYHCAPVPVVLHGGRLWRAFERTRGPNGERGAFRALMVSARVDADLLRASSWSFAPEAPADKAWLGGKFDNWLEGNAVVAPDGEVVDVLRVNTKSTREWAAIVHVGADGASTRFDPTSDFVDFPGGSKKFTIRFDGASHLYWTLASTVPEANKSKHTDRIRNTLSLLSSPDLRVWTVRAVILHHDDAARHGFHYVDWQFDGEDLIAVSRTGYDDSEGGAHSAHDANYLTFHRVERFRDRVLAP